MKYIFLVNIVFALLYAIVTTVSYNVAVTPGDSYYEFAKTEHYPEDTCHTTVDGSKIFCYIKNATTIEECIEFCTVDRNRCKSMKFTKLNECVFYIDNATRGCDDYGVDNIKEWTYNNWAHGGEENDVITVTYTKKYDFTGLRVRWMGNMRSGTNCNQCGIAYWFKFNGAECSNPEKIDHAWYNGGQQRSELRHGEFEGICYGLHAGDITIAFHVGRLRSGHNYGDAKTGWYTSNRIIAEEVDMRERSKPCLRHSVFNMRQKTAWFADGRSSGELPQLTFEYKKLATDTGLRLKAYLNIRGMGNNHCIRYYFTMNGQECSDPYAIDTSISWLHGSDTSEQLGSRSFEGICDGLSAGDYTIKLMLGSCPWGHHHMDAHTGWASSSRIIAEEVRYSRPAYTVYYDDATSRQTSTFNLQHWNWYNLRKNNTGVVVSVEYTKTSNTSGVRMLFSGVTRATTIRDKCARWYFTFNGDECSDPGQLEGLHYEYSYAITGFDRIRPKTVSGICKGTSRGDLTAGKYSIDLRVGDCQAGKQHDKEKIITGYQTRMTIMAEEVIYSEGPGKN